MSKPDKPSSVNRADIGELLPFYLNRSLEPDEARRVERHLAESSAGRQEEYDTRTAWSLYEGHLPVELILDVAFDAPMSAARRQVIESHLAVCERCSQEVALVQQEDGAPDFGDAEDAGDRAVASEPAREVDDASSMAPVLSMPQAATGPSSQAMRRLAWAACFVAVVASYGWFSTWQRLVDARGATSVTARANVAVVELLPAMDKILQRSGPDPEAAVNPLPAHEGEELVLVLLGGGAGCESGCRVELYGAERDRPQWQLEGLQPSPDGLLTLALPVSRLPEGRSVLAVRDLVSGELINEYLLDR
ncbi:MAG: zf-HC2 domain-containing protein [Acidobacteriota bacterium]